MPKTASKSKRVRTPKGGLRIGGRTYRPGSFLPQKYARALQPGQPHGDPAKGSPDTPPNFGRPVLPHILTFGGLVSTFSQVYKNPDTAIRDSVENARIMRQDCSIMECLEARQRATALLNWHIESEDQDDPDQKELCAELTRILARTPRFTEYRRNLLEAIWYGRYAVQNLFGFEMVHGVRRTVISNWRPINGDKLTFRFDDGSGRFIDEQVGIRVGTNWNARDAIAGNRTIEYTDQGPAYFLESWERSRVAIHKHMIEDGVYEDPITAGRIHGVGIRDRIYWCWFQKQETLAHLMEVIERTGTGFTIYYYPDGNPRAKAEMEDVAAQQTRTNVILMPRSADDGMNLYDIQRIEPSTAGVEVLRGIIAEFFGHQIKRYILGQTLSTEASGTGLGSGLADLHEDMFLQIVAYDAANLEETISKEVVRPLKEFNFPRFRNVQVTFKINTEGSDSHRKLEAFKSAWDMGAKIRAADVMDVIGAAMPQEGEDYLFNPQMMQQVRLLQQSLAEGGSVSPDIAAQFGPLADLFKHDEQPMAGEPEPPAGPAKYSADQSQQVGATKVIRGVTYRLNENHRWERVSQGEPGDQGGRFRGASGGDQASRDKAVKAALSGLDPMVAGVIRALHESPEYKSGGAVTTMDVAPSQAKKVYDTLRQAIGQDIGGGQSVDFGDGAIGFASAAGSFVIAPGENGKFQVFYTNQTELVGQGESAAGSQDDTGPIATDDTQAPDEVEAPPVIAQPAEEDDDEEIEIEIEPEAVDPAKIRQRALRAQAALDSAVDAWEEAVEKGATPKELARHRSNVASLRAIWREHESAADRAEKQSAKQPKAKGTTSTTEQDPEDSPLLEGVGDYDPTERVDSGPPPDVDWSSPEKRMSWQRLVRQQADAWDMTPKQYEELATELYKNFTDHSAEVEAARKFASQQAKLNQGDIERLENQGYDAGSEHDRIKGLDTIGRELASMFPGIGWGGGYDQESVGQEDVDYAEKVWNLIRQGAQPVPSRISPEFVAHIDEFLKSNASSKPYVPDPDAEAVPFAKQTGLLTRYRKWLGDVRRFSRWDEKPAPEE